MNRRFIILFFFCEHPLVEVLAIPPRSQEQEQAPAQMTHTGGYESTFSLFSL